MNERIKELIEQATTIDYGVDNGFDRVNFDKEKFAELILLECTQVLFNESERLYDLSIEAGRTPESMKCAPITVWITLPQLNDILV
jgi:hypothetical protein